LYSAVAIHHEKCIAVVLESADWAVIINCKMNKSNRDLLVLFKEELMSPQAVEQQLERLHEMLFKTERLDHFASAHEMIDLNRYKIHRNIVLIKKHIRSKKEVPFVFLNTLN
jgi:hypothetical protein